MGLLIKSPVRVKVVMTPSFRDRRTTEIRAALARLEVVGRQLVKKLEPAQDAVVRGQLEGQLRKNEQTKDALKREVNGIAECADDNEYDWGILEGTLEVNVGDDFSRLGACEIVVKDNKIIEIRDGVNPDDLE